jgi:hypothetical protein
MATLTKGKGVIPTTPDGWRAISRAVDRFLKIRTENGIANAKADRMNLEITLDMVNRRTPLDLARLADDFDDFNLVHDIGGMARHVNKDGSLSDFFEPRCTLPRRLR